jgi:hypothetical protein
MTWSYGTTWYIHLWTLTPAIAVSIYAGPLLCLLFQTRAGVCDVASTALAPSVFQGARLGLSQAWAPRKQ